LLYRRGGAWIRPPWVWCSSPSTFVGIGPVLKQIEVDTGLAPSLLGLLITMPVIAFGAVSALAAPLARRFGLDRVLVVSLFLLAAGVVLRSLPHTPWLFAGAALLGAAVAVGNVLVSAVVRRDFAGRIGPMTSVFVTTLAGLAAVGAGLAVPLADTLEWRWRWRWRSGRCLPW
jgi:CP family cyanate transporter-like MFS transporter